MRFEVDFDGEMISVRGAWRSDGRAVGGVGAAVAEGHEAWPTNDMDQAAAGRRHSLPGPDRHPVAGHARQVQAVGRMYDLVRRWQRDGTWRLIFTKLQALGPTSRN